MNVLLKVFLATWLIFPAKCLAADFFLPSWQSPPSLSSFHITRVENESIQSCETREELINIVKKYLDTHRYLIANLNPYECLQFFTEVTFLNSGKNAHTNVIVFVQKTRNSDLIVEGTFVHFTIWQSQDRTQSRIIGYTANLYPEVEKNLSQNLPLYSDEVLKQKAEEFLNISAGKKLQHEVRAVSYHAVSYIEGKWRRIFKVIFKNSDYVVITDMDTLESWMRDDRLID